MDYDYQNRNPDSQAPPGGEQPVRGKKKKKVSVGRIIAKTVGWIFLTLFTLCVIGVLTVGIFFKIFMTYVDTTLIPSLGIATAEEMQLSLASTMYDANGTAMLTLYDNSADSGGNRELIEFKDLPDHLINALVAIEDKRFWEHNGVDWYSTGRAMVYSVTGAKTQGGSTITQQVLRDKYKDTEVTVKRKFREIFRALEYEKYTSKEDIITDYLNRVYFGAGSYGIQTAAKTYFGKNASELDLAECAAIVGITNNPSLYDPFHDAKWTLKDGTVKTPRIYNKERQELILDEMQEQGYITEAQCAAAKAEKLMFTDTDEYKALHGLEVPEPDEEEGESEGVVDTTKYNTWFQDAAINEAIDLLVEQKGYSHEDASLMLYRQGYHIETTFDPAIQAVVDSVYQDLSNFDYPSADGTPLASAITIIDPYTGDVKAMAGGVGQKTMNRELNLATSRRTPGSAIKPVSVYAPAIDYDVVSPGSIIDDYPINTTLRDNGYPRNSTVGSNTAGGYSGYRTVSYAVQQSLNTVSVRTLQKLTYARSFEFMENNLGFDLDPADIDIGPLAMGGLTYGVTTVEMAAAYSAFANEGIYTKPRLVTKIWNNDRTELVVDNDSGVRSWPAMKETTAYLMNKMLRNVVTSGTGTGAQFDGMTIAGKTGTTSNNYDRYFVGYTPYYSAAVWIGYRDKPERITVKGNPAAVIWKKVMEPLHEGLENKSFPDKPDGIITVSVCADCGLKPSELCSQDYRGSRVISAEIQASAAPKETCTCHVEVQVCTDPATGEVYLAGPYCPLEETVTTRVMLVGREHLERPDGSIVLAGDSDAHLSYFSTKDPCPIHDEFYVPVPVLPEDWTGEPTPGDPNYQWPTGPWNPDDVLPPDENNSSQEPGFTEPAGPDSNEPTGPAEPEGPSVSTDPFENDPEPNGANEPVLPEEPVLP